MQNNSNHMLKIGFIGQGFIGKNMADDFAERGHDIVRYSLDREYVGNKEMIAACEVVFIAVPTPTTSEGFDSSALEAVLPFVGMGKIAVIKSTILPGMTGRLQEMFPEIVIIHSPEFLRERHAFNDTRNPPRTILGLPEQNEVYLAAADLVMSVLPPSPYKLICQAEEAELIKYGGNTFLALKVIYMNLIYDLAAEFNADYNVVADAMAADTRIGSSHMQVVDSSGHEGAVSGRGAGGHCFPKDLAALREIYEARVSHDTHGADFLRALEDKNNSLLQATGKDMDLIISIYGEELLR